MIPWDQLREEADEDDLAQIEQWQPVISEKTLVVALGIVNDFVLLSVGNSTDHLGQTGMTFDGQMASTAELHCRPNPCRS